MFKRSDVTLYNVIFPIWLLWLFPAAWIAVLPANFIIDLAVVYFTMRALRVPDLRINAKAVIFRVWLMGFVADFIGTALMFFLTMLDFEGLPIEHWWYENISSPVSYNAFESAFGFLAVTLCVAISGFCIYWFNRKFCLSKAALDAGQKHKLALSLAVFTSPYLFYLPTMWFYRG